MLTGFLLAKFVHLAGVLLWMGSAIGLGIAQEAAPPVETPEGKAVRRALRRASAVEHAGFLLLLFGAGGLLSGLGVRSVETFLALPLYLRAKFYLTVTMALPLVLVEMILVHAWLRGLSVAAARDAAKVPALEAALRRHDAFRRGATLFVAILLPTLLVLAVFRPA